MHFPYFTFIRLTKSLFSQLEECGIQDGDEMVLQHDVSPVIGPSQSRLSGFYYVGFTPDANDGDDIDMIG